MFAALMLLFLLSQVSYALTLDEYGISLSGNGLVDHVSGLQWLDSGLTQGGLDELQFRLDDGWRIASEEDLYFLITRQQAEFGGTGQLQLNIADFMQLMAQLSIDSSPDGSVYSGPWVCRAFGDPQAACASTNALGGKFIIELAADQNPVLVSMFVYISEVPIYGSIDCFDDPDLCDYMGRSLLVRAVPLPGPALLLFSALILYATRVRPRNRSRIQG